MVDRLKQRPWFQHVMRALTRFTGRLGTPFAAAITYFSVLAVIPVLMLSFSVAGFVLTVARPDLLDPLANAVADFLGQADPQTRQQVLALISRYLSDFTAIGVVGVLVALYAGAGWMGNLKNAFRVQSRSQLDVSGPSENFFITTGKNLLTLAGLVVAIAVTFALASLSTTLADTVVSWLGLDDLFWLAPALRVVPIVFSVGAGWLLFRFLFTVLPERPERVEVVRRGALLGAIGLGVLQYSASFLIGLFNHSKAIGIFGPVIALMLFFNLFAQLILFTAAWVATADHPALPDEDGAVCFPLAPEAEVGRSSEPAAAGVLEPAAGVLEPAAAVAVRRSYLTGAATGVGLGAAVVFWLIDRARRP